MKNKYVQALGVLFVLQIELVDYKKTVWFRNIYFLICMGLQR